MLATAVLCLAYAISLVVIMGAYVRGDGRGEVVGMCLLVFALTLNVTLT